MRLSPLRFYAPLRYRPGATVCFFASFLATCAGQPSEADKPVSTKVEEQVRGVYEAVLARAMPVDPNPKSRLDRCGWRLVVRVLEDTDGVEEQLAFERGYDGNTDLEVSRADGDPLRVQLEQLYAAHQGLTVDEAASRIRLSRVHLDGRRVKKVSLWSEKLARASVPTAIRMDFFLHGTVYRAWSFGGLASSAGDMNYWTLAFMGPGPQARKQPNRFIDVVEEIRRGVEKLDWQKAKADKK